VEVASAVLEASAEAVQEAHSVVCRLLWRVSGARMSAMKHRSTQAQRQAQPIAPGFRSLYLVPHQTCSVASSPTVACSGPMIAAQDQTDGASVAPGRRLRSWEVVPGQTAREGAGCTFALRSYPSPAAHSEQVLAVLYPGLAQAVPAVEMPASSVAHASRHQSSFATWPGPSSPLVLLGSASLRETSGTGCRS
jgi:hypothetical protein